LGRRHAVRSGHYRVLDGAEQGGTMIRTIDPLGWALVALVALALIAAVVAGN
jgi:hypothetical protein